jgi:hypothetical protein
MFDVREEVDRKPHLTLNPIYYGDSNTLKFYFVDFIPSASTLCKKTDIEDIEVEVDGTVRIVCILFRNASERIAKPITEEERKNLALKCEEETKELEKWSNSIVHAYDGALKAKGLVDPKDEDSLKDNNLFTKAQQKQAIIDAKKGLKV